MRDGEGAKTTLDGADALGAGFACGLEFIWPLSFRAFQPDDKNGILPFGIKTAI
jgi:hypothetical protein